jgi:chaperonin GroES
MASQPDIQITDEQEVQGKLDVLTLDEILTENANLAEFLTDSKLSEIGQKVTRDVEIDEKSREEWLARYDKWLAMAMQVREQKNFPWPKASNVKFPLLTVASIQFQARAYPSIVDGSNLVKGRVLGPDPDGTKRQTADAIGNHMTWQLLYKMPDWEEDTDKLLLMLPILGCVFRKAYYDSIHNTNCVEMVSGKDFIINYWAKGLDRAPRYTHVLRFYPYEVREKVSAQLWRDVPLETDVESAGDDDAIIEFYEQHRYVDLDGDGYPEPYIVTATKNGQVARMVPCFGRSDVKLMVGAHGPRIVSIERRKYFTKYSFIPAPDGSFYDIGFGWLLEDIGEPINTAINQMLDAGTLQNAGGGFLGSGINIRGGTMPFRIGEWKRVEVTNNASLSDNIFRLDHPGPSPVLFQLLGQMIEASKDITSVQDVLTGEGQANQPATTTLALIEQGHKVMTAIFKRVHRSFGQELRNLFALNREYLDDEETFLLSDGKDQKVARDDYNDNDLDVVPVSDPNLVTDMQKLMRSEAEWTSFNNDPLVNQLELRRRRMDALGIENVAAMLTVPPPAPDPKVVLAMMAEARAKAEAAGKVSEQAARASLETAQAAQAAYAIGAMADAAALAQIATQLGQAAINSGVIDNGNSGAGGVPALAGPAPDPSIPQGAGDAPGQPGDGMVAGPAPDAGAASPGSAVGQAGGGPL